ncbi:MAG: methylenetetrahydrofolate reductase [Sedimentisphaerales bacterium]
MKVDSKLAKKIENGDFIVTAEYLPSVAANGLIIEAALKALGDSLSAVNVADNHYGVAMSSLAASVAVIKSGAEPICQIVTRDRNRIALQSDLLGAAYLGIKNVLCLSGYHQTLIGCPESASVYDIDSTQFIEIVTNMSEKGVLADGTKIDGRFSMLVGAVANPFLEPLELNMLRLNKKIEAGAKFIQTHAVFDIEQFSQWLDAAGSEGITGRAAIIASVLPLDNAVETERLRGTYIDYSIPDTVVERLKAAGSNDAQKKEGLTICVEMIKKLKEINGVRGIHILSGGKEKVVPEILAASGL